MSNQKDTKSTDKKMTKYDYKMQMRAEKKAQEKKAAAIWKCVGVLLIIGIIAFIASFPIRRHMKINKTVFTVGDTKVSQVEYDYYYNVVKNNYLNNNGMLLQYYYGIDLSTDMSTVKYSEDLSFADYFQQLTAEQLQQNAGMYAELEAAGFTCDTSQAFDSFVDNYTKAATEAGMSLNEFLKANFGTYASKSTLKPIIERADKIAQYYEKVSKDKTPDTAAAEAYYQEHKAEYDNVDYYSVTINASLPVAPTELADAEPVFNSETGAYTPSEAEKAVAMDEAKEKAEEARKTVATSGVLMSGKDQNSVDYNLREWLFDDSRIEGETTVVENTYSNSYTVVSFVKRYRPEQPTVNVRAVITTENNGEALMSEYTAGGANIESFLSILEKYSDSAEAIRKDGLYENLSPLDFDGELGEWMFDSARAAGDVKTFWIDDSNTYFMYYVGEGKALWNAKVSDDMLSTAMEEYVDAMKATKPVSDPDGFLVYKNVEAAKAAAETAGNEANTEAEAN